MTENRDALAFFGGELQPVPRTPPIRVREKSQTSYCVLPEVLVPDAEGSNNPELLAPGITSSRLGIVTFGALSERRSVVGLKPGDPGSPGEAPKVPMPGEAPKGPVLDELIPAVGLKLRDPGAPGKAPKFC